MRRRLSPYQKKRDFAQTPEPRGGDAGSGGGPLRFVIQKHAARRLHYDFRLELGGTFRSWAVTRGPSLDPADKRLAVEVEDHPLEYGDFEGTIPQGQYGGGTVQLWDRGYWHPEGDRPPERALADGELKFSLEGQRLGGSWVLVRMRQDRDGGKRTNWLLIKHRDSKAQPGAGDSILRLDRSVASGRTMQQIAAGTGRNPDPFMTSGPAKPRATASKRQGADPPARRGRLQARGTHSATRRSAPAPRLARTVPTFISPQLCKLVDRPPDASGWGHEVKLDGYRVQLQVQRGKAVIRTRKGLDWTERFAACAADAAALPDCIIDGEIVAVDANGLPSFAGLQAALSEGRSEELILYAFDLLFEGRRDCRPLTLDARKRRLEHLLGAAAAGDRIRYVEHLETDATRVLASACRMQLEGIVSKRLDAPYVSGRSGYWTKAKCRAGQEVVLGGWTHAGKTLRSLLAGVYRDGQLDYIGRIGTGYGAEVVRALQPRLEALTSDTNPFGGNHPPPSQHNVRWLKPSLVAEIEFAGWTESGMIRQAAFKGLREDKMPKEIVVERSTRAGPRSDAPRNRPKGAPAPSSPSPPSRKARIEAPLRRPIADRRGATGPANTVLGVAISNPDKPLWPAAGDGRPVTKLDLAHYFEAVGEWMLPHVKGRPCSLVRAPDGIGGPHFFQRHAMPGTAGRFSLVAVRGDKAPYLQIDQIEALPAVAQLGGLEIHPWNCAPGRPELPGRLVFDLDPAPDVEFAAVIDAAKEVRERLAALGLAAFCKTTGGKGLHVVVPLATGQQSDGWPTAKQFAHLLCAQMAADSPAKYLDSMAKQKRVGRIFLDYLRNDRSATAVAPLSPRARDGATVSMPIAWKDVGRGLVPTRYTVRTAPQLMRTSRAWADYADSARPLAAAIRAITKGVRAPARAASARALPPRRRAPANHPRSNAVR